MNYARLCLLAGFLVPLSACPNDDGTVVVRRGVVDEAALVQGVLVSLSGTVGTVTVPFEEPVPEISDGDFQDEMEGAVALLVTSAVSGSSAAIGAGTPLDDIGGTPAAAGEFTWELNSARDEATMTFFNETPSGLTLKTTNAYSAQFSVAPNDYVETVSAISFPVMVQ
ncbi:MAG: hypothetical protein AAF721_13650 [Myxococcota bacterium]